MTKYSLLLYMEYKSSVLEEFKKHIKLTAPDEVFTWKEWEDKLEEYIRFKRKI